MSPQITVITVHISIDKLILTRVPIILLVVTYLDAIIKFSLSRETLPPTHTNSLQNDMRDYSILGVSLFFNQYYSQVSNPLVDFIEVLNLYFLIYPDAQLDEQTDTPLMFD